MRACKACGALKPLDAYRANRLGRDGRDGTCRACRSEQDKARRAERGRNLPSAPDHKTCTKCGEQKAIGAFARKTSERDGFCHWCKECHKTLRCMQREYRHPQRKVEAARRAAMEGREYRGKEVITREARERRAVSVWGRLCRERESDLQVAVRQGYGATPNERAIRRYRERYTDNPVRERLRVKRYKYANPHRVAAQAGRRYRRMALQADGTLTPDVLEQLYRSARRCPYCGVRIDADTATLDHLEPVASGGVHGISNVTACCNSCNARKGARPFSLWLEMLAEPHRSRAERLYRRVRGFGPGQMDLPLRFAS